MKRLCFSKIIVWLFLACAISLHAKIDDKSVMIYYGKEVSYPIVGIHDYIILQANHINVHTHGFDVYKHKIYAYVSVGEIQKDNDESRDIKPEWIIANNKAWNSYVLDLRSEEYQEFLFSHFIEPQHKAGFENFFFDTLDSYQLATNTPAQKLEHQQALVAFIKKFSQRYPNAKLILNRGFEVLDKIHADIEALAFESYYYGLDITKDIYRDVDNSEREWLDKYIEQALSYGLDVISIDYLDTKKRATLTSNDLEKYHEKGLIPYIGNRNLDLYGRSSKETLNREILFLVDESKKDRVYDAAHMYGALPVEYLGYIQKLHDVASKPLPDPQKMERYAGVVVWLSSPYKKPQELIEWILAIQDYNVKVVFFDFFGFDLDPGIVKPLGIDVEIGDDSITNRKKIVYQDEMIGFEIQPTSSTSDATYLKPHNSKQLLVYEDRNGLRSTQAAITPWGGYAIEDAFMVEMGDDNIWVINPFIFLKEGLGLKELLVPDTTTLNGKRILFSHIDGDGIMNKAEWKPKLFAGDVIYEEIIAKYNIPQSISVVGGEINSNGMYPEDSERLQRLVRKIYALPNVESATHTFSHPFYWNKIQDGDLAVQYRLNVPNYIFNLDYEIAGSLKDINHNLKATNGRKAKTIFWTGDCIPAFNILDYVYKNKILNINGGDTYISNTNPWLSAIAPLGLERGEYYQIYTGAQNENVYTNNWNGPYWGYKQVVQTYELTNSPKRFKPINIYYHFYAGSKKASLNAIKYALDWSLKQDVIPTYTSQYIPMAMDFYTVSLANEGDDWHVDGLRDIKTLRVEREGYGVDMQNSKGVLGVKHFESHSYISLDTNQSQTLRVLDYMPKEQSYLVSSNGMLQEYQVQGDEKYYSFRAYVPLEVSLHAPTSCSVRAIPKAYKITERDSVKTYYFRKEGASFNVVCK